MEENINPCSNPLHREHFPARRSCTYFVTSRWIKRRLLFASSKSIIYYMTFTSRKASENIFLTSNWKITSRMLSAQKALVSADAQDSGMYSWPGPVELGQLSPYCFPLSWGYSDVYKKVDAKAAGLVYFGFFCFTVIFANTTLRAIVTGFII